MQIYYDKFKESFPNYSKQDFESVYSWLEREGFISLTRRHHIEIYQFYLESLKNYPEDVANKCAEIDTADMFEVSRPLVRAVKSFFVRNY